MFRILLAAFRGVAHGAGQQFIWRCQLLGDDGPVCLSAADLATCFGYWRYQVLKLASMASLESSFRRRRSSKSETTTEESSIFTGYLFQRT